MSETSLSVATTLTTPLGRPALSPSSASASAECGVSAASLRATVQPAAPTTRVY